MPSPAPRRRWRLLALAAVLLTGCTDGVPDIATTTFAPLLAIDLSKSTRLPSGTYLRDLSLGTGPVVQAGQVVTAQYQGWLVDGTEFDANQGAGFQFTLGAGEVIAGWDRGVPGMRVGGSRQLIIPPDQGYGSDGTGPIPPNAILVFSVTVKSSP